MDKNSGNEEQRSQPAHLVESAAETADSVSGQLMFLECAMCSAPNSFVISPFDPAVGYCFKEQQAWRISLGTAICHVCKKMVPTRYCELCDLRYCNEGEDDDRWCAIEHDNRHEDAASTQAAATASAHQLNK